MPVDPIPSHLRTVTPRLVVSDGRAAIDFYRAAFGAEEIGESFSGADGELIHAELRIGDAVVMITSESGDGGPTRAPRSAQDGVTAIMVTYWEQVDVAWQRALAAGADVVYGLADQFYGERSGRLRDPFGQQWMMTQRIEELTPTELSARGRAKQRRFD